MLNPFEEESHSKLSIDQFESSLPICLDQLRDKQAYDVRSYLQTPISIQDLDKLSQKASNPDVRENELRESLMEAQHIIRQINTYNESLQHRNLEMVLLLQKEKMKNKQLLSALSFVKTVEEDNNSILQTKIRQYNDLNTLHKIQKNGRQSLENEVKTLRLENSYLKQMILIANNNYQKLQESNKELLSLCKMIEEQKKYSQVELLKKKDEIKCMFTAIVVQNHNEKQQRQQENVINTNITNFSSGKSRREPVQDAYRQFFMKTLKQRNRF